MRKILASLLLLAMVAAQFSCGSEQGGTAESTTNQTNTTPVETEAPRLEPTLPDKRWDGYEFRVLTKGTTNVHWKSKDIAASEENGDTINDAVYKRNLAVTDRFGVKFVDIPSPDGAFNLSSAARTSIMAGSDDYDMIAGGFSEVVRNLAPEGLLVDLNTVPYIDLTKPWYDRNSVDSLSICGKTFGVTGDMLIMDKEAATAVLFNKKMAEDYKLGNFYDMVRDGSWTIDRFDTFARAVAADINNDGVMDEKDQYGMVTTNSAVYFFMLGCGVEVARLNKDNVPELVVKNEKLYDAFSKAVKFNDDYDIAISGSKFKENWEGILDPAFTSGRSLFYIGGLNRVTIFRAMETDFGILPAPKYDENQEEYYSMVSLNCTDSIIIPKTVTDLERTGAIIEALSAEGHYVLKPAYEETVLRAKGVRDEESSEMLDIILNNRVYDLGEMYNWGSIVSSIYSLTTAENIASTIDSNYNIAAAAIELTVEDYKNLE